MRYVIRVPVDNGEKKKIENHENHKVAWDFYCSRDSRHKSVHYNLFVNRNVCVRNLHVWWLIALHGIANDYTLNSGYFFLPLLSFICLNFFSLYLSALFLVHAELALWQRQHFGEIIIEFWL